MKSLLMSGDGTAIHNSFIRGALGATTGLNERCLQETLFAHPDLLPLEDIDPAMTKLVPICKEFRLPRAGGDARVDILAATNHGRLVLVECKLWRNPEARREVVGQIFEYASLLRGQSYSDLESLLTRHGGLKGTKPLFEAVKNACPEVAEEQFVDSCAQGSRKCKAMLLCDAPCLIGNSQLEDTLCQINGDSSSMHFRTPFVMITDTHPMRASWHNDAAKKRGESIPPFKRDA